MSQFNGPRSYILIGRSGCGKGTQADLLIQFLKEDNPERGIMYLQTGQEIRDYMSGPTYTQKLTRDIIENGGLMPEYMAVYFWAHKLTKEYEEGQHMVIDGTPRKLHEAMMLDLMFPFYKIPKADVIYLNVSREWAQDRLMSRMRADDTPDRINKRLNWFEKEVEPSVRYYRNNPEYRFFDVDAERTVGEIHKDIITHITA